MIAVTATGTEEKPQPKLAAQPLLPRPGAANREGPSRPPMAPLRSERGWYEKVKCAADFIAALVFLALTAPLLLLAMLAVKLTSRGPALYTQTRLGKGGRPFTIYKLRTMAHKCESLTGARWAIPGDPRVTPLGRFLRRTHLDELPQLWNVLRGEMSLVGPRPERPEFAPQLEQAIPHYRQRLQVRPGVTGLAQVQLPPDTDLESVRDKTSYDLYYVIHYGWWLDLRIVLCTGLKVIGVSFGALRGLFGLPQQDAVEAAYKNLSTTTRAVALRSQTA